MAYTLYIIDNDVVGQLPQIVRDTMLAETRKLYTFISGFKVKLTQTSAFPARIDFSDSVMRVVETDGEINSAFNNSLRLQTKNLVFSGRENNVTINTSAPTHNAGVPDRGGTGLHQKEVLVAGNIKLAYPLTVGVASLYSAKEAIVLFNTKDRTKDEIEQEERDEIRKKGLARTFARHQSLRRVSDLIWWELADKPLSSWTQDNQIAAGTALGRLIAHEARHEYVGPGHSGAGLGADGAALWGQPSFAKFDSGDENVIKGAVRDLVNRQKTATVHLENNPRSQPFPW